MKLRAPDVSFALTHQAITYAAKADGSINVPEDLIHIFKSHRCEDWSEAVSEPCEPCDVREDSGEPSEADQDKDQFSDMKRAELFAWLKEHGVIAKPPISYAELRRLCRDKARALFYAKTTMGWSQKPTGSDETD